MTTKRVVIFTLSSLMLGMIIGSYLTPSASDYWSGVYYPNGNTSGNAIYSPKLDSKEECVGWAINERGNRPQDSTVSVESLWECNKNCKLDDNYKHLINNNQQSILDRNAGPIYVCDDGGFDGGDWIRGQY